MGNHASSCFVIHSSPKAKLIDGKGNLRQVKVPIKAAELMLEQPGHAVSPVDEIQRSQRIFALRADDELLAGKVYFLVRVSRVNGKVTKEETAMIEAACEKKKSLKMRKKSGAKVLPAVNDELATGEDKESDDRDTGVSGYRFGKHRQQWSPVLESISELY